MECKCCICKKLEKLACGIIDGQNTIINMLSQTFPMTIFANYPEVKEAGDGKPKRVTYVNEDIVLTDLLNPNIFISFRGSLSESLPVYFKDKSGFEHTVSEGNISVPVIANAVVSNATIPALFSGNFIILNPVVVNTSASSDKK